MADLPWHLDVWIRLLFIGIASYPLSGLLCAAELPADWKTLPAMDFARTAEEYLNTNARGAGELPSQVIRHMWSRFLANDESLNALSPAELQALQGVISGREGALKDTSAASGAAINEQIESRLNIIHQKVRNDLLSQINAGTTVSFRQMAAAWRPDSSNRWSSYRSANVFIPRAEAYAAWLDHNDPTRLNLEEQIELTDGLQADRLNPLQFSARWSGFISAPVSGEYAIRPLQHCFMDGNCRIVVDGKQLLDTRHSKPMVPSRDNEPQRYPVTFSADQPLSLIVEYFYDRASMLSSDPKVVSGQSGHIYSRHIYPLMVLQWEREEQSFHLIPPTAYSHHSSDGDLPTPGLRCEYFRTANLQESVGSRSELGVYLVGTGSPVFPHRPEAFNKATECLFEQLMGIEYQSATESRYALAEASPFEWKRAWFRGYAPLTSAIDGWNRLAIEERLLAAADFSTTTPNRFHVLFREMAMLPGEGRLQLLRKWADQTPPLRLEVTNTLSNSNIQYSWLFNAEELAVWLRGNHRVDLDSLLHTMIVDSEGFPRLRLICVAAAALRNEQRSEELLQKIHETLDDPRLGSDQRAAWLCAQGWSVEALAGQPCYRGVGSTSFQAAVETATSSNWKYYATREVIARLITTSQFDAAIEAIELARQDYNLPSQIEDLRQMGEQIELQKSQLPNHLAQTELDNKRRSLTAQQEVLKDRIDKAIARGDAIAVENYQRRLRQLSDQISDSR